MCGLCPLNFALSSAGCIQCPAAEPLAAYRAAAAVIGSILLFLLWVCISWDHLLPETVRKTLFYHMKNLEKYKKNADNLQNKTSSVQEEIDKIGDKIGDQIGDVNSLVPYLKINITFYQVLGSFLTFNIPWPYFLLNMMAILKSTVFLDLFNLPGVSCLWIMMGASFKSRLLLYTIVPLVTMICLGLPLLVQYIVERRNQKTKIAKSQDTNDSDGQSDTTQWDSIYSRFQKNLNIFIFLIYSVVSVVTLEAFNCNPPGLGLLTADLRELCPENGSFLIVYSIIFILVYPIGICSPP